MEFTRTQRTVIGAGIGVMLIAGAAIAGLRGCDDTEVTVVDAPEQQVGADAHRPTDYITVHVIGAVHRPGLYYLRPGARVYDAVSAAGGFFPGANEQAVNLAAFVQDGQQVHIPARARPVAADHSTPPSPAPPPFPAPSASRAARHAPAPAGTSSGAVAYTPTPRDASPAPTGDVYTPHTQATTPARTPPATTPASHGGGASQSAGSANRTSAGVAFPVNINLADEQQLQALPGVGSVLADRIVSYRMEHGPFERPDDLLKVKGIGQQTLARMAPYITLQ